MDNMTFTPTGFSDTIFRERYALTPEETWPEACLRVAKQMALAEVPDKQKVYEEKFQSVLVDNLFVPGGRIWYGSGKNNPNLLNCFVLGSELDSKEGWGRLSYEMIVTSMQGGGCGIDYSDIRPNGASINTNKGTCPGPVAAMHLIDGCAEPVRAGGGRRCLPKDSNILTSAGVKPIREIRKGDFVLSENREYRKVLATEATGNKETLEIHTRAGTLICTPEHRVAVLSEIDTGKYIWKEAQTLVPGDSLLYNTFPTTGVETSLPSYTYIKPRHSTTCKNIDITALSAIEWAWLIGYLHGDGYVGRKQKEVTFAVAFDMPNTRDKLMSYLSRLGLTAVEKKVKGNYWSVGAKSRQLAVYLSQFKTPKTTLVVPDFVKSGRAGVRVAYLAGVFDADGCAKTRRSGRKPLDLVVSVYPAWIHELTGLTDSLGIPTKVTFFTPKEKHWQTKYRISPVGSENKNQLAVYLEHYSEKINNDFNWVEAKKEQYSFVVTNTLMRGSSRAKSFHNAYSNSIECSWKKFKTGAEWFIPNKIEKITLGQKTETFDLQVEGTESFIADGHLVHNSALMYSLDLDHPDVEEFLDAKLVKGQLTHANVSVRSKRTSDFIDAVKTNSMWELSWKGKYKTHISARKIWKQIVDNAYSSAEPGFLNWELVNSENTIYYIGDLTTVNPCGEVTMQSYENCCLGHLVLPRFVKDDKVDYTTLAETIRIAVRFLDNVLSVNHFPLPEMKEKSEKLRRIGLGVTGLADMLALLGLRYGSEDGNAFLDKLFRFISKTAYEASVMLAIEKGPFPLCNPEKHIDSGYVRRMTPKIRSLIKEHGIRNCAILTNAPTGTVSILSGNCSSGIEPIFAPAYERRYWKDKDRVVELVFHPLFQQFMAEGRDVSHFVSSHELSVRDHLEVQKVIQRHIDNAISKTINMPEDYSVKEMGEVWLEYLPYLKGTTFYRENTRGYVDKEGNTHEPPLKALSLKEAQKKFKSKEKSVENSLEDCPSGVCSI